jgi:hypothetical protein
VTTDGYTATIIGNSSFKAKDLTIPQFVGDGTYIYEVKAVGNDAFYGDTNLTGNLTIPNVETIGQRAFKGCGLTGTLSIGAKVKQIYCDLSGYTNTDAFDGFRFTDIIIDPKNEVYGFATNVGEAKIVVAKKDESFNVNYSSNDLQVISKLAIGKLTIPYGVTYMGEQVFMNCSGLTGELIIPDTVTHITGA